MRYEEKTVKTPIYEVGDWVEFNGGMGNVDSGEIMNIGPNTCVIRPEGWASGYTVNNPDIIRCIDGKHIKMAEELLKPTKQVAKEAEDDETYMTLEGEIEISICSQMTIAQGIAAIEEVCKENMAELVRHFTTLRGDTSINHLAKESFKEIKYKD
jgi:hypothetical protein